MKLEELRVDSAVSGLLPNETATIVGVQWFGTDAVELTYKDARGSVANELLFRDAETRLVSTSG